MRPSESTSLFSGSWWLKLLLALLATFYILFTGGAILTRGSMEYLAVDYRPFRCSAEIAWRAGFAQVYDVQAQEACQRPLYEAYTVPEMRYPYATMPMLYLPIFLLPLLALLPLPTVPSLIAWTVLNALVLVLYLGRLIRRGGLSDGLLLMGALALSFPSFDNLFFSQVNVLLLVCLGEFLLASRAGHEFRGGLWLAGFLIKPHALLLLLPALLIGRRFRALAGFAAAGLGVLLLSLALAGPQGMLAFGQTLLHYPEDLSTSNPHVMANWRALAIHLAKLLPEGLAWGLGWAGTALTALAALSLWVRPAALSSTRFVGAVLGTAAATCATAWHMHAHTVLFLAAPLILVVAQGSLRRWVLLLWALGPAVLFALLVVFAPALAHNLTGLAYLGLSLGLLSWSVVDHWRGISRQERSRV